MYAKKLEALCIQFRETCVYRTKEHSWKIIMIVILPKEEIKTKV